MGWFKSKNRPADNEMSKYVRARDNGLCQYNFKCYVGNEGSQTSHFQKRRKESVRFDPDNCDWVCGKCHYFVENNPGGQKVLERFKLQQLGLKRYNALMVRANTPGHKDDKLNRLYIKTLLEQL